MSKNYYEILGVSKNSSKEEIKKAFHKLAHKHHPDKGGDENKFKEINEAYQILSDDKKRAQYDNFGSGFNGGGANWNGFDFSDFAQGQGVNFDFGDIFSDFFNQGRPKQRRGRDISVDIEISFAESVFGTDRKILINKISKCDECQGEGGTDIKKCATCDGKGKINEMRRSFIGTFATVKECSDCYGSGKKASKPCSKCKGEGVYKKDEEINIKIPSGINNQEMIRLSSKGEAIPHGINGDLYIKVHVEKHPVFSRLEDNLTTTLPIKISESLLGSEQVIELLDGSKLTIKIPSGITSGEILKVKGKGVPIDNNKTGDLLVKIIINIPQKLSKRAKKLVEELKEEGL